MVKFYSSSSDGAPVPPFAIVLVSLRWDASRLVVANWLASERTRARFKETNLVVFLSDGWEDLVIFVGRDGPNLPDDAVGSQFQQCTDLIKLLNQNPFVATTESLFARKLPRGASIQCLASLCLSSRR